MQISYLRYPALSNSLVDVWDPREVYDVGIDRFVIAGRNFGAPCDLETPSFSDPACSQACAKWNKSSEGTTHPVQVLSNSTVMVQDAKCYVMEHNNSMIVCDTNTSKRSQRYAPKPGEWRGQLMKDFDIRITMVLGNHLAAMGPPMAVATQLLMCGPGKQRAKDDSHICELCPKGKFAAAGVDSL